MPPGQHRKQITPTQLFCKPVQIPVTGTLDIGAFFRQLEIESKNQKYYENSQAIARIIKANRTRDPKICHQSVCQDRHRFSEPQNILVKCQS